ncbi:N-acetyltransferase [Ligilactobacillus sp. WILCCON 0076]|uniref:N-acetyltransferase n=1 Tax=Ligilactobacillus ubinensis TaxID=2876789 RepID=A0A9X2JM39_9LACO|nr:GNAT family N-acetyltransferase [Ligilactobacillus ubinensis]MCP0887519.1 N-acetyltransferase [Ligilactobacillus ubinensis]
MSNYQWQHNSLDYLDDSNNKIANIGFKLINNDTTYVVEHTWVSESARGQGLAGKITVHFLEHIRTEKKDVVPLCPFTQKFFKSHPEYSDLLKNKE